MGYILGGQKTTLGSTPYRLVCDHGKYLHRVPEVRIALSLQYDPRISFQEAEVYALMFASRCQN